MMKRKLINVCIFFTFSICSNAQIDGYKFYASIDSIATSGFYNILLSPEINAHLKTDYSDVRIVNAEGKWVPHALHVPSNEISREVVNWDLNFSKVTNDKTNTILFINGGNRSINNIELSIRNTAAERYCSLSGSDDEENWFVINDSILINPTPTASKSVNDFRLNFPLSNYKFYKLVIVNGNKYPFEINGITTNDIIYDPTILQNRILENPTTSIFQKDSGKISYIKVTQKQPYHFDGLNLAISGVKYYVRKMEVFAPVDLQHSFSNPGSLMATFTVSNNSNLSFHLPIMNDSVFYIYLYNEDNLPIKLDKITTTINEHFIKVYLEKGNNYRLLMDNEMASQPNYDITKLNLSLIDTGAFIRPNNIVAFPTKDSTENKKTKENKWIMWTAIIGGLLVLLLLTKQMIKELNKKQANDNL